jgi:hypothetical protein
VPPRRPWQRRCRRFRDPCLSVQQTLSTLQLKREYPKRFGKIDFALPEYQQIKDAAQWD